jgi:hypothetical protein
VLALAESSQRKPILRNRVAAEIEVAVVALAVDQPARRSAGGQRTGQAGPVDFPGRGALRLATTGPAALARWVPGHDLTTMQHRLSALEAKMAQNGLVLTEARPAALRKIKAEKRAHGKFGRACPGHCGAQDTF